MKQSLIIATILMLCLGVWASTSVSHAQPIFVPRDNSASSDDGEKRKLFVPKRPNQYMRSGPGADRQQRQVFEPRNRSGYERTRAEREADRNDAMDRVQQMNIDLASRRSAENMEIIARQRQARQQERRETRRAYAEQKERERQQAEANGENLPPEARTNVPTVNLGDQRVILNQSDNDDRLEQPPRIFNTYQ